MPERTSNQADFIMWLRNCSRLLAAGVNHHLITTCRFSLVQSLVCRAHQTTQRDFSGFPVATADTDTDGDRNNFVLVFARGRFKQSTHFICQCHTIPWILGNIQDEKFLAANSEQVVIRPRIML